jgi:hypothetical protein
MRPGSTPSVSAASSTVAVPMAIDQADFGGMLKQPLADGFMAHQFIR